MDKKIKIVLNTKELKKTFKNLMVVLPKDRKKAITIKCALSVTGNIITFSVPGASFNLTALENEGNGTATFPFMYYDSVISDVKGEKAQIEIGEDYVKTGITRIAAQTVFIEQKEIFKLITLPVGYSRMDLLRLEYQGFSQGDIVFSGLMKEVSEARTELEKKIASAFKTLKIYDVEEEEIIQLIEMKIKGS